MKKPKVIQLLKSFDKDDWRECGDFLKGRVRQNHDCTKLYEYIKKYHKNWDSQFLEKKTIKEKVFGHITDKSFTNVLSKLSLVVEDYLVLDQLKKEDTEYKLALLRSLSSRGLFHQFDIVAAALEKRIANSENTEVFEEFNLLRLNHLRFFSDNPIKKQMGNVLLEELSNSSNSFHNLYDTLLQTVQLHLNELSLIPKIVKKPRPPNHIIIDSVKVLHSFKIDKTLDHFKDAYDILMGDRIKLPKEVQSLFLEFLIHDGHQQFRTGNYKMAEELLNLYKFGFDSGILLSNKKITENRFINAINAACVCQHFGHADMLLHQYSGLLGDQIRDGTIAISKAHIDFAQERYQDTIDRIKDFPFSTIGQNARRRWMLLSAYYKLFQNDTDFMESQIKNYNSFFYNNKNKLSDSIYKGSLNLGKLVSMMTKGLNSDEIMRELGSLHHVVFRSWVLKEAESN